MIPEIKVWRTGAGRLGLAAAALEAAFAIALLATSAYLISRAAQQPPILHLMAAVVGVRAFALGRAAFRYLQRLALHDAVFQELARLRPRLFERLAQLVPGRIPSRGEVLENFTSDVERLQEQPLRVTAPILQATAALTTSFAITLWILPISAIPILVMALIFALLATGLSGATSKRLESSRIQAMQQLRTGLQGFISHVDLLRSYQWSAAARAQIVDRGEFIRALDGKRVLPSTTAFALLSLGAVITAIGAGLIAGLNSGNFAAVAIGTVVLMPLAVFDVFSQLQQVAQALASSSRAKQRLCLLMDEEQHPELVIPEGEVTLTKVEQLELKDLSITRAGLLVQGELDLKFEAGKITALTGASGSGKTSLAYAIASLISPARGKILVNSIDLANYSLSSRRSKIILVEQDPHLFRGTVKQNLVISGQDDDDRLLEILDAVGLGPEFADRGGLAAAVFEDSNNISGGQAQRIAIARGLLAGAETIILDEPTSGLDRENALALFALLRQLADLGKMLIVITHESEYANLCDERYSIERLS